MLITFYPYVKKIQEKKTEKSVDKMLKRIFYSKTELFCLLEITDHVTRQPKKEDDFETVVTRNDNCSKDSLLLSVSKPKHPPNASVTAR